MVGILLDNAQYNVKLIGSIKSRTSLYIQKLLSYLNIQFHGNFLPPSDNIVKFAIAQNGMIWLVIKNILVQ